MMGTSDQGILGSSVRREEDCRFLTGSGQYTDDVNPPNHVHAYFLRSPHAHAKIRKIDTQKAKAAPGVALVIAETPNQAEDAAELITVDYEVLPAVVNGVDALKPGAPLYLYPEETAMVWASVHDALSSVGVKYLDMPASPHRVWSAIQSAKRA